MTGSLVRRRGLTLVELLVIISLVGLVAGLLLSEASAYLRNTSHEFPAPDARMTPDPGLKDLAGEYSMGGLGRNCRLMILEDGRFSFVHSGCTGVHERNQGYVTLSDGRLILSTLKPNIRSHYRAEGIPTVFLPVKWNAAMFLVAAEDVVGFCDEVNRGVYESPYRSTWTYARGLDRSQKLHGLPDLPEPWTRYLLARPVEGTVVTVSDDGTARVDLGTKDGVYVGMTMSAQDGDTGFWTLKVDSAEATSAVVSAKYGPFDDAPLRPGLRVASRFSEE